MYRNPHPWRIMSVVFAGTLLCCMVLMRLFSPAGDAVLDALNSHAVAVTGTIAASRSQNGKLAFYTGSSTYRLSDQTLAGTYAGREVRVTGILHETTGVLEIRRIEPALRKTSRLQP